MTLFRSATAALLLLAGAAQAAIVSADIEVTIERGRGPDMVFASPGEDAAGPVDLGAGDAQFELNPDLEGFVEIDLTPTGGLRIRPSGGIELFEDRLRITISDIVFDAPDEVTGASLGALGSGFSACFCTGVPSSAIVEPFAAASFTPSGASFVIDAGTTILRGTGGTILARIETAAIAAVPVPASLPLMLAGLGGLALARRRRG